MLNTPPLGKNLPPPNSMPHPLRAIAKGRMIYSIPNILQIDDASGAVTKQWNVHYNAYSSNASLPRRMVDERKNVEFVATSPNAGPMEIFAAVDDDIR